MRWVLLLVLALDGIPQRVHLDVTIVCDSDPEKRSARSPLICPLLNPSVETSPHPTRGTHVAVDQTICR